MKLVNIADEGAKYKWQLYDLYDKAFPEQEKKPLQVMENLVADGKMEMLAMVDEDEFVGLAINLLFFEDFIQPFSVKNICFIKFHRFPCNLLNTFKTFLTGVAEVIQNYHIISCGLQFYNCMTSDKSCSACY